MSVSQAWETEALADNGVFSNPNTATASPEASEERSAALLQLLLLFVGSVPSRKSVVGRS